MNPDSHDPSSESIELPAPTPWPMVTALGVALLLAGLITHPAVSVVGALLLFRGGIGWWRDVLPHAKHVAVPLRPPSERVRPVAPEPDTVSHLKLGEGGHRVRIPAEIHPYSAGIKGGLVGGAVMAVLAIVYGLWTKGSLWYTVNLLSAAAVPSLAQAGVDTLVQFSLVGLLVGIVTHLTLSISIGLLYAVALPMFPRRAWLWAGILTPLFWTAFTYPVIGFINPNLAQHIDWFWFVICQVAFGMTGGYVVFTSERVETMQTWPLAARAGLEATHPPEEEKPKP